MHHKEGGGLEAEQQLATRIDEITNLRHLLQTSHADVKRLMHERDKLLSLSNSLKAQLNRQSASNDINNTSITNGGITYIVIIYTLF